MIIAQFIFLVFCFNFALSVCPHGSFEWDANCLFFKSTDAGYANAEIICRNMGGHLASIHDAFTNAVIGQEASNYFQETGVSDFWIGLSKLQSNRTWTWADNTPLDYKDWKKGEPNKKKGNDCAAMSWENGYWSAQSCFKLKAFVCEVPNSLTSNTMPPQTTMKVTTTKRPVTTTTGSVTTKPTATPTYPTNYTCPDGWQYFQPTGSCYEEFFDNKQPWISAESLCQSNGAHLSSVHSDAELAFLRSDVLTNEYAMWIGLNSTDGGNTWQWTDNTPFDYVAWKPGYGTPGAGTCVLIVVDEPGPGMYLNWNCDEYWPAICKKSAF